MRQLSKVKLDLAEGARWNSLAVPYLFERGGLDPDAPAIVFEGHQRTYGEVRERARRVANALIGFGIESMDRVAVLSSNRLEFIEIEVGIAAARAIMVPLNWRLRPNEIANLLRRSEARAIFVEDRFLSTVSGLRRAGDLPDLRTIIAIGGGDGDLEYEELSRSSSSEPPERVGRLEDPHEIIFTSGTTGEPKGVVWTNGGVIWNSLQQIMDYRLGPDSSSYAVIDLFYIGGRHDFTWPVLHAGGTVHIKRSGGFDADAILSYVTTHAVTHILLVPTMLYEILDLPDLQAYDTSRLQMIMCGGQAVSAALTERAVQAFPATHFIQVYGLTEGGGSVTFVPPKYIRDKPGSAGRPSMHAEIKLVDDEGTEVAAGSDGEVLVRGPSVTAGYWDAPDLTETLITDGWLHTGDMGHFDQDGFLYISGRKRDLIISGGMNIYPSEIEDVLVQHPSVAGAAVIGIPHEKWGETVCAVIEPRSGAVVDPDELIRFCDERLAGYKRPVVIEVLPTLPRTASGKVQKFLLRERFTSAAA